VENIAMFQKALWLFLSACSATLMAQTAPEHVSVKMVVTVAHFYGKTAPVLTREDLTVTQMFDPLPVTNVTPFSGERAGLEMFILVDNCSDCDATSQAGELRAFIRSQPKTTSIGVAYIQQGHLKIIQEPTVDRDRVINSLSPPTGSSPTNPFGALSELIANWKPQSPRRAILMVTNGVDPAGPQLHDRNPAAEAAIEAAQRGSVTVFAIYHPSADYINRDFSDLYSGQVQMAHVAHETGGEGYFLSFGPMPSISPFLDDIAEHLANQYLVEFLLPATGSQDDLRDVKITSNNANIDVMAPDRVWVPARTRTE
jgi:hypothetical protein